VLYQAAFQATATVFYSFGVRRADPRKRERGHMSGGRTKKTTNAKTRKQPGKELEDEQSSEREAILDERQTLKRLFPAGYSPDIGVFNEDSVEVMFKLTRSQAENLARLLKEHKL